MRGKEKKQDRRCCERFPVFGKPLAVMRPGPGSSGRVDRISAEAVEIVYRPTNGSNAPETEELDILVADFTCGLFMRGVPVKTISDSSTEPGGCPASSNLRRRILAFAELKAGQRIELERFIQNFAL
jgi:hypothetical protein